MQQWYEQQEKRRQLEREAEHHRMVKQARAANKADNQLMMQMGRWMEDAGKKLQQQASSSAVLKQHRA